MTRLKDMQNDGGSLLSGLRDLRFETVVTTQMVPTIYTLGLVFSALSTLYMIAWGFGQSLWIGSAWVVVLGPAMFLALAITIRVLLEFVLTVFRIAFFLEALGGRIDSIAGQTEEIAEDLPRIRFWRSRRNRDNTTQK
ncbi:DUF4282 domain-containing protein [Endozoicomonas sp. G2_2]|uniref:DUF4282 domain-containing protein n=1 Tax=Endozoicomonas sp. G2_2 TaxID=2821092 RepID=UPI001ADB789F|nr:DUF4282 domain-containing protein [Endozoicomonas sp. G2_2]MBO9470027.1 DUF4282 domain-containing protein [Endozoicomonas sp. G2_2]